MGQHEDHERTAGSTTTVSAPVRVHVSFEGDAAVAGETLWATPMGGDAYEIANVPFFAATISYGDVVRAVPHDGCLEICEVLIPSGQCTLGVVFAPGAGQDPELVAALSALGVHRERATGEAYSLSVARERRGELSAVLAEWEQTGRVELWSAE